MSAHYSKLGGTRLEHIVVPKVETGIGYGANHWDALRIGRPSTVDLNQEPDVWTFDDFGLSLRYSGDTLDTGSEKFPVESIPGAVFHYQQRFVDLKIEIQVLLVERFERFYVRDAVQERRALQAIYGDKVLGVSWHGEDQLLDLIGQLASQGKVLEATMGLWLQEHQRKENSQRLTIRHFEGRLKTPPTDRILQWLEASPADKQSIDLTRNRFAFVKVNQPDKFADNIYRVVYNTTVYNGYRDKRIEDAWGGEATLELIPMPSGKYVNQSRIDVFVEGMQIGSILPQFRDSKRVLFEYVEAGLNSAGIRVGFDGRPNHTSLELQIDLDHWRQSSPETFYQHFAAE